MSTVEAVAASVGERLTWSEIIERFPDSWIVYAEPIYEDPQPFDFTSAIVLGHTKTRKDRKAIFDRYDSQFGLMGARWTGERVRSVPRYLIA